MNAVATYQDARKEKQNADARRFGPAEDKAKQMAERAAEISATLKENPHIGVIMCNGTPRYYAFILDVLHTAASPETLVRRAARASA